MAGYPMTPSQQATAERKGWTRHRTPAGKVTWKKPKDFGKHDQDRIDRAERRRQDRRIGAD